MANGIIKCQAEYYEDTVKYPGNPGTATNKACIEDVFDLLAWSDVIGQDSRYDSHKNYGILVNDIDFNDHPVYRYGFSATNYTSTQALIRLDFRGWYGELDGDNHSIYNILLYKPVQIVSGNGQSIRNINFKNLVLIGVNTYNASNYGFDNCNMYNCNFGILSLNCHAMSWLNYANYSNSIEDCTFNVKGTHSEYSYLMDFKHSSTLATNRTTYTRCLFNFDITLYNPTQNYTMSMTLINSRDEFINCAFTGNSSYTMTTNSNFTLYVTGNSGIWTNSYCAINFKCVGSNPRYSYQVNFVQNTTIPDVNFVVKDNITNEGIGITDYRSQQSNYPKTYFITDAEAKSSAYLQSIGFLVV